MSKTEFHYEIGTYKIGQMKQNSFEIIKEKIVSPFNGSELFGYAANCKTLSAVLDLMRIVVGKEAQAATAAYGMLLAANTSNSGPYRADVLALLDLLSHTKMELDSAICHASPVFEVTSQVLLAAQWFAEEATIPCTEWPSVEEVIEAVLAEAKKYAKVDVWELVLYHENGYVIGTYVADTAKR